MVIYLLALFDMSWSFNSDRIQLSVQGQHWFYQATSNALKMGTRVSPWNVRKPSHLEAAVCPRSSFVTRDAQHEYLAKSSWTLKGYILFLYVASLLFSKRWRCLKIVFCTTVILLVLVVLVTVVLQLMAPHSCKWKVKISGLHNPLKISKYVHCLYKCFNSCYFYLWVTNWLRKLNVCVCPGK